MPDYSLFEDITAEELKQARKRVAARRRLALERPPEHERSGVFPLTNDTQTKGMDVHEALLPKAINDKATAAIGKQPYNATIGKDAAGKPIKAPAVWNGVSRKQAAKNLSDSFQSALANPEHLKNGEKWYREESENNKAQAAKHGVHPEIYHAVTAALSPRTDWNVNKHGANRFFEELKNTEGMDDAQAVDHMMRNIAPNGLWKDSNGVKAALRLARHDPNASDRDIQHHIAQNLRGTKVRNFYNNLSDPEKNGNDVTIDKHMVMAALAGEGPTEHRENARNFYNAKNTSILGTPAHEGMGVGIHAMTGDMIRKISQDHNNSEAVKSGQLPSLSPAQVQAVIWNRELERNDKHTGWLKSQQAKQRKLDRQK